MRLRGEDSEGRADQHKARRSCEQVPGLELHALDISPEAQNWKAIVTFVRWEREQSS